MRFHPTVLEVEVEVEVEFEFEFDSLCLLFRRYIGPLCREVEKRLFNYVLLWIV